jgi:hypothetical protein
MALVFPYRVCANMLAVAKRWGLYRTTVAEHLPRAGVAVRRRCIPADKLDEAIRLYAEKVGRASASPSVTTVTMKPYGRR